MAGNARRELKAKTGAPVLSEKDYLGFRGKAPAVEASAKTMEGKAPRKGKKA